jgi:radical SAM protein with 4Fe4S-binding SPASM domain
MLANVRASSSLVTAAGLWLRGRLHPTASAGRKESMDSFRISSRYRRLRRLLGAAVGRPLLGPQVVSLETTHHCNLRCSFCESHGALQALPITSKRDYVGGRSSMELATIRRLAPELAALGVDLVELSGKGDPIAHPELTEIVRIIRDAGLGCALVTNGTMAKPDLAPTLVEKGLDRLSVSLNSGNREVFLRTNGKDLWDRAAGFLRDVLAEKRSRGVSKPWVRITHVVTKENVSDMEGMVEICVRLGVDEVAFYVMGELPESEHLQLEQRDIDGIRERAGEWGRRLDAAHVVHTLPIFSRDLATRARGGTPQENPLQRSVPCYEGWMFCVIGPDGVVVPCCYCEGTKLGNVVDRSFGEIWRDAPYRQFRQASLQMPKTGRWICRECFTTCNRALENHRIYRRTHLLPPSSGRA